MSKKKVLLGMSGGIDSSVAVLLLKDEYDVTGVNLKLFDNGDILLDKNKTCCSLSDVEDARSVAFKFGIDFFVYNFSDKFKECVVDRFNQTYINGDTPNPCIDCNRFIKFDQMLKRAMLLDMDFIATGHYAIKDYDEKTKRYLLKKAVDSTKDQTYVLYGMTQEQLKKTLFPLGKLKKQDARQLALDNGLINADKPDSQDICFVPNGKYAEFIEEYTKKEFEKGDFIDLQGNVLGKHKGIVHYTVGQRKGLGIALGKPMYVVAKDAVNNTVTLGDEKDLYEKALIADDVNFISIESLKEPMKVKAKTRYKHIEQPATISPMEDGRVLVVFDEPQRALTTGQAVVFYDNDIVVGGGIIVKTLKEV